MPARRPFSFAHSRKLAALGAVALGGLAVAGLDRWRQNQAVAHSNSVPGPVSDQRMLNRNLRLAKLGARSGSRYGVHRAKKVFASAERTEQLNTEFEMKTAADVTAELGNMKGAMMKLGQMASYIDTGLPDNVRHSLASLQHDAPPMSGELAALQIEAGLGKRPEDLFLEWDPVPIASASIGQVHRAITHDDRAIAVKIQYPGVAEAVASDLGNMDWIFSALGGLFPGLDSAPIVAELKERLLEELDYEAEARNQSYYSDFFDDHPFITVPRVLERYSSSKILTSELASGVRYAEMLQWSQEEKNLAAETIFRFSFGSIYRLRAFNGDPHPGNYLFESGGRVTFLDFGLVKRFSVSETQLFDDLLQAMVIDNDVARFRRFVEDANLLAKDAPFSDEAVGDYFRYFYRYVLEDNVITIDAEYAADGITQLFDKEKTGSLIKQLNVPPSFVVLQRITLGLIGLFAELDATANFRKIAEEVWLFADGPPSTPMGEAIAQYRLRQGQSPMGL